jgi:protein-disulfide isomerase
MEEENKGKVIVIRKKLLIVIAAFVIVLLILAFFVFRPNVKVIADDSPMLGSSSATVYVVEFSDYECSFCQAAEGTNQKMIDDLRKSYPGWEAPIPKVIEEYVNTGKVKLVFRQFPVHQDKNPALAAVCAKEQGKFWEYHRVLFENYNALTITDLKKYAADLNLNLTQFNDCLDSKKYEKSIQNDLNDGTGVGVSGTPTFFIGNEVKGYRKIVGAQSFSFFKETIDSII